MRIGIDLGGTKIEAVAMDAHSTIVAKRREATPRENYADILSTIARLVKDIEAAVDLSDLNVGMCTPGSVSPTTGLVRNSNTTVMNGKPFIADVSDTLGREVRTANDADCLALSEAFDGSGIGAASVFGVILGTGCGGGIVINQRLHTGKNAIGGEWGHNPLPWPNPDDLDEIPGLTCWCGNTGCQELYLSGTGLEADYQRANGRKLNGIEIATNAALGNAAAVATMDRYHNRLARGLASIINVLDPEVIVLGGGVSNTQSLYREVPKIWGDYVFSDEVHTKLVQAKYGDSSGVRGAAWLWPEVPDAA